MNSTVLSAKRRLPIFVLLFGLLMYTMMACTPPTCEAVTTVTINQGDKTLLMGVDPDLTATVVTEGGVADAVSWSSSRSNVASINVAVTVTALSAGTTVVTATSSFDAGKSDSIEITVTAPTLDNIASVNIDQSDQTLLAGTATYLRATVLTEGNPKMSITWLDSHPAIATINPTGTLETLTPGTTTITATSNYDNTKNDSTEVTVTVTSADEAVWTHQFGTSLDDRIRGIATARTVT